MGKRKSSKKAPAKRKNESLPTVFSCLFCNHEKAVQVKLDKKESYTGHLECKVCGQSFQCVINYLSAEVDVYSEWVDAADTLAQEAARPAQLSRIGSNASRKSLTADGPGTARPSRNLEPLEELDGDDDIGRGGDDLGRGEDDVGAGATRSAVQVADDEDDEY